MSKQQLTAALTTARADLQRAKAGNIIDRLTAVETAIDAILRVLEAR